MTDVAAAGVAHSHAVHRDGIDRPYRFRCHSSGGQPPVNISTRSPQASRLRTFVLVDPTSPDDGRHRSTALDPTDDHVSLVVLISGRSSSALRQFADIEGIDPASAASIYLDQVADRIARDGRSSKRSWRPDLDPAIEIADLVALNAHAHESISLRHSNVSIPMRAGGSSTRSRASSVCAGHGAAVA